ncbi:MAG: cadherin-like beta sandwich domain-containing protein [Clostridia bacterium]|nr:cadherin-like beta sandwich domain-containing protein [Clostridia bacterium]
MKKIQVIKKTIIAVIILLFVITVKSMAADLNISSSKNSIANGESASITISSVYTGKVNISVSGGTANSSTVWVEGSASITVTANSDNGFKVTVTPDGDMSDSSGNLKSISSNSISIAGKTSSKSETTNKNTTPNQNTKPETPAEPTFKSANETVYATGDINIRKSYSADSNKIGSLKKGESVTRTGIGDNGWSKVTYNGSTGYIKTSLLTTEEPAKSSDKALKTLEITPEGLDPEFNPETTTYTLTVGPEVEKLDIKAAPNDENAKVEITGNDALQPGDNVVKITVTAQDETTRIYNINVKKQENEKLGLTSIKINGYTLSPKFSSSVYEYKLNVLDPLVTKLDISAEANNEDAKVEISGNSNLQNGENTIVITVTSQDGTEKVVYQIYVNKSSMVGTTNNKDNMALYIGIGVMALVIIIIIIIIIKSRKKKYDQDEESNDYSDLYGYSSKEPKLVENKENIEKYSKKDIENELFGKLPNDIDNSDSDTVIKNEDNFNYNPYVTKDIYGDYDNTKDADIKENSESKYNDLYGSITKNEDFSFREKSDVESTYNNSNISDYEYNNKSMIETTQNFETEYDNTIDNNYKTKRSKGKHSK